MVITPTRAYLKNVTIGGTPHISPSGANFHVKEFRIYEDICKPYFTAQLVIETHLNWFETFLFPTAETFISFSCPRSDEGPTKVYSERFRILSYETKAINYGADARNEHTIALIGQEYFNDKHNVVIQNFNNQLGTAAAANIHKKYIQASGSGNLKILPPSLGMIGLKDVPHQTINKKPIKAIHDIIDRCVYSQWKSCAPVYYRDKSGYVLSPLQYLMEQGPVAESFQYMPAMSHSLHDVLQGYNNAINFRPVAPSSENSTIAGLGQLSGLLKAASFFDYKTKNFQTNKAAINKILDLPFIKSNPKLKGRFQAMLAEANKGSFGGANLLGVIDELMQKRSVDKNGPGKYNTAQEAFLTTVGYSPKYWISVPGQTGLNVTCGNRINVLFSINDKLTSKTLFVPRLVHEVKFTQGDRRDSVDVNAITEFYGVHW